MQVRLNSPVNLYSPTSHNMFSPSLAPEAKLFIDKKSSKVQMQIHKKKHVYLFNNTQNYLLVLYQFCNKYNNTILLFHHKLVKTNSD